MSMLIPLGGFALGLAVGRWWIVAVVMPFWAGIVWMDQLDGRLTVVVASQLAVLLACAVGSGVAVRRLYERRRRRIEA
jgi:hypothetical protein